MKRQLQNSSLGGAAVVNVYATGRPTIQVGILFCYRFVVGVL